MSALALAPAGPDLALFLEKVDALVAQAEQAPLPTSHFLHGGLYVRSMHVIPSSDAVEDQIVVIGLPVERDVVLTISGPMLLLGADGRWIKWVGVNTFRSAAGRRNLGISCGEPVVATLVYRTDARTVEEAEAELYREPWRLLSRRQGYLEEDL